MFGKKIVATGTCAVLAAGFLAGGVGLSAQAAAGDAAYTQAVNRAIIYSDVYGNGLLAENDFGAGLFEELTGKKLASVADTYYDDSVDYEDITTTYVYSYDASGVQTSTATTRVPVATGVSYDDGPLYASTVYDAAGYPTNIIPVEPDYYTEWYWYNKTYQNTYDEAGRLTGVTIYTVRLASDPKQIELTTPTDVVTISYDAAGRISQISEHINVFDWSYSETGTLNDLYLADTYEDVYVFGYDALNQVATIDYAYVYTSGESGSSHNEYTYNSLGEVLTHTRVDSSDPNVLAANRQYVYDGNGILTEDYEVSEPTHNTLYVFQ